MSLRKFVEKETDGYLRLAKHVIADNADGKNLILSPLSIHMVLAMTTAGASGSTRAQLLTYLKSERVEDLNSLFSEIATRVLADGSPLGGPLLSTKNGLWVERSFTLKPSYRDIVHNFYKAAAEPADFQNKAEEARKEVNEWAKRETRGLIKEILSPGSINKDTRLILANAVYFKGTWFSEFDPGLTKGDDFYLIDFYLIDEFEANEVMEKLGVVDLFGMGGLTEMVDSDKSELLFVNRILQKAFVEVNEAGTEAAAVTVEDVAFGCSMYYEPPQLRFVADHPFLFLIREETSGVVLFVGKLLNPLVDASFEK